MADAPELDLTWKGIEDAVSRATPTLAPMRFKHLVAITRGGLIPTALLANTLNIRDIGCIMARSYKDDRSRESVKVSRPPCSFVYNNPQTLFVDDITDTGHTMAVIARMYPNAWRFALVTKPQGRPYVSGCAISVNQDVWVNFPWENTQKEGVHLCEESELPS